MPDSVLSVSAVEDGTPQAIVILFGWLGSRSKHVQEYAKLYQDRKCSTIHGAADVLDVILNQKENLSEFGLEAVQEASKQLKSLEDKTVPVIIHVFGTSGALVLEQLTLLIHEAKRVADNMRTKQEMDLVLLADAIERGGEFFDSGPAYLHLSAGLKAIEPAVPNIYLRLLIQIVSVVAWILGIVWLILQGKKKKQTRAQEHWSILENSSVAHRQAFIYSISDDVIDQEMLEELIAHRKQRPGAKVLVQKLKKARHCSILLKHQKEYASFVKEFLGSILEQKKEEEILQEDPDMTDYQMEMD